MAGIPYNRTAIIQTALNILGFPILQSIQAYGNPGLCMDNLYDITLAADLSSPNWRFANKVAQLSQVAGVDPDFAQWNIAYQVPPDCLAIWRIWPVIPYEVFGERLWSIGSLTGNQPVKISYRALQPESKLPPAYIMYFCYLLADQASPNITKSADMVKKIEAGMTKWRAQAMITNTQGRPNVGLTNSPWVNNRAAGSFMGTGIVG